MEHCDVNQENSGAEIKGGRVFNGDLLYHMSDLHVLSIYG